MSSSSTPSVLDPSSLPPPAEITIDRHPNHPCLTKWAIPHSSKLNSKKILYSPYFEVGGFDFRILLYPKGDSEASPGYFSVSIQIDDRRYSLKFGCFTSFKLSILNHEDKSKSLTKESYFRFSCKEKTYACGYFGLATSVFNPRSGFFKNGSLLVSIEISILDESVSFSRDDNNYNNEVGYSLSSLDLNSVVLNGKFTWKVKNFSLFGEKIKTQKIASPDFQVGKIAVHVNVHKTNVNGVEFLSLFLEANAHKGTECSALDKTSWCLFQISVLDQKGTNHKKRESYGRFDCATSNGEDRTLGWTDYMKISDIFDSQKGFVVDDNTVVFMVNFKALKESEPSIPVDAASRKSNVIKKWDTYSGIYDWEIENFKRLKDSLKRKKMRGVFFESRKFQIGNHEFCLAVYPRGKSEKPSHLSMFLEVSDPWNATTDWSCFASYRLIIRNQKTKDISMLKKSQERFSKSKKELGWSEFVTLTNLFDKGSRYVVEDAVTFGAEVHILKETFKMQDFPVLSNKPANKNGEKKRWSITWKVENFLSFKRTMPTQKIYSKCFQVDRLELRIGVDVLPHTITAYLECDPSVANDPDKDFCVSYRMKVVNQDNSFSMESSLITKTYADSDLQFMKLSDRLEIDAGFVTSEMVTFVCEILDYFPWSDFSELEVLGDVTSTELHCRVIMDILRQFFAITRDYLNVEDNTPPMCDIMKELKMDLSKLAGILIGMRLYLDNPAKLNSFVHQLCGSIDSLQIDANPDKSPPKLSSIEADLLRQKIDNALLDVMVDCCHRLNRKSGEDPHDAGSKPCIDTIKASSQTKLHWRSRLVKFLQLLFERIFGVHGCTNNCSNTSGKAILGRHDSTSESSEDILGFIINTLKSLDDGGTQDPSELSQGRQVEEKILVLINKAPKHLLADLVSSLPKLAYEFEHEVVACALLDQLQMPGAESSMRLPVLEAMCQWQFGIDIWERAFFQASEVVGDLNGEALGAAIHLLFNAASKCQHIPQAVSIVLQKLESIGAEVSPYLLDLLRKTLNSSGDIAVTMLQEIDSVFSLDQNQLSNDIRPSSSGENGLVAKSFHAEDHHFSYIFMLLEMLAIPSIAMETAQAFEKGIANGFITHHLVEMVLEKYASVLVVNLVSSDKHQFGNTETAGKSSMGSLYPEEVFTLIFSVTDQLFLSRHTQVHGFLRKFYPILFNLFANENYRNKMLRRLVEHAMSANHNCSESSLDVLVSLVHQEVEVSRLVVSMFRDYLQLANSKLSALHSQLHAEKELQTELLKKMETLLERLDEFEAATLHYQLERDCSAREKKELSERLEEVHFQFQQQNDQLVKLSNEKKGYQMQLSQLSSQKEQELKKVDQEKNDLAEWLRTAEAERKKLVEELRRLDLQIVHQKAAEQSRLNKIQKLEENSRQIITEKEEKIAHLMENIEELKVQLNGSQQRIQSLQVDFTRRCYQMLLSMEMALTICQGTN